MICTAGCSVPLDCSCALPTSPIGDTHTRAPFTAPPSFPSCRHPTVSPPHTHTHCRSLTRPIPETLLHTQPHTHTHTHTSAMNLSRSRKDTRGSRPYRTNRTSQSRRLVEEYWRSVLASQNEPPLYHTLSDRYGGAKGIPFASRTDCSMVVRSYLDTLQSEGALSSCAAMARAATFGSSSSANAPTVEWYMEATEESLREGRIADARSHLKSAMTRLQNNEGSFRGSQTGEASHASEFATVLRRLGAIAILCADYDEALNLLNHSSKADPLTSDTYALRASCYERLRQYREAFDEYVKYLKLTPPTLEVVAHCGKCAALAGLGDEGRQYLRQLQEMAAALRTAPVEGDDGADASAVGPSTREDNEAIARYYTAHTDFYLGVLLLMELQALPSPHTPHAAMLRKESGALFAQARCSGAYVHVHEANVAQAIQAGDFHLAIELLRLLTLMNPDESDYHLQMAHVYHMLDGITEEVAALSEALDRRQSWAARRTTFLARGTLYLERVGDIDRAIKDFTMAIDTPLDDPTDCCLPIPYLKRAEAFWERFQQQQRSQAGTRPSGGAMLSVPGSLAYEDRARSLEDYRSFLSSSDEVRIALGKPTTDSLHIICDPKHITNAMLILANGAFGQRHYREATMYFSKAITRGWKPQPLSASTKAVSAATAARHPLDDNLYDQMYLALAHCVVEDYPPSEEMFKVPYEQRDTPGLLAVPSSQDSKRLKSADRREAEKLAFASSSLSYTMVDARYCALKSLEPTVFSALDGAFLQLWEPYRAEVERVREDTLSSKGGRRLKRHA